MKVPHQHFTPRIRSLFARLDCQQTTIVELYLYTLGLVIRLSVAYASLIFIRLVTSISVAELKVKFLPLLLYILIKTITQYSDACCSNAYKLTH